MKYQQQRKLTISVNIKWVAIWVIILLLSNTFAIFNYSKIKAEYTKLYNEYTQLQSNYKMAKNTLREKYGEF